MIQSWSRICADYTSEESARNQQSRSATVITLYPATDENSGLVCPRHSFNEQFTDGSQRTRNRESSQKTVLKNHKEYVLLACHHSNLHRGELSLKLNWWGQSCGVLGKIAICSLLIQLFSNEAGRAARRLSWSAWGGWSSISWLWTGPALGIWAIWGVNLWMQYISSFPSL